ncbi:MAG TPA: hypothetical protein VFF99_10770 [Noviherbaspirillum sp.]|nr:hypothetical protein [Noviherbaspirillum sp.]HZW21773.1 hypothetical protein [Noviherbaspirillum sp.]
MAAPVEHGVSRIHGIFQHVEDLVLHPLPAALQLAGIVQRHGDRVGTDAAVAQLEDAPDGRGLIFVHREPLALTFRNGPVSERHSPAVEVALGRILHHAAPGVLAYSAAGALVHHLEEGFQEPAFVRLRVDRHRDIDHVGPNLPQIALVLRRIDPVARKARSVPGDEIVRLVQLAVADRILELRSLVRTAGNTVVGEHLHDDGTQFLGLRMSELQLALDRQFLAGLLDRADPQVDDRCLLNHWSGHREILFFLLRR